MRWALDSEELALPIAAERQAKPEGPALEAQELSAARVAIQQPAEKRQEERPSA